MGRLQISETLCYNRLTHNSAPLSLNCEHRNSISCLAALNAKSLYSGNTRRTRKRKMLYFWIDFGELNVDGLKNTGDVSSAILDVDLCKNRFLAPHTIINEGTPTEIQTMVANRQKEVPIATVELQFEIGNISLRKKIIVVTNLTSPLDGLFILKRNNTILDMRQET